MYENSLIKDDTIVCINGVNEDNESNPDSHIISANNKPNQTEPNDQM